MGEPLYRMIAEDLRHKIESGELPQNAEGEPDSKAPLPTENELQAQFGASRNTIRQAVQFLSTLGLVETRPGQGTFVAGKINPFVTTLTGDLEADHSGGEEPVYTAEVAASGRTPTSSKPTVEIKSATGAIARALRLDEGAEMVSRHQQRFLDGTPWSLQTTFYPMSLVEQGATRLLLPADMEEGAVAYLARECNLEQAGYRDTISVRPPEADEAWFFRLPADGRVSVFEVHRVGFDKDGNRIRLTVTVYPADRNRFRVAVGKVPARERSAATTPEADT